MAHRLGRHTAKDERIVNDFAAPFDQGCPLPRLQIGALTSGSGKQEAGDAFAGKDFDVVTMSVSVDLAITIEWRNEGRHDAWGLSHRGQGITDTLPLQRDERTSKVGVKFLSEEWMAAMGEAANGDAGFKTAAASGDLKLQFTVTDMPEGDDTNYTLTLEGGAVNLAPGADESADATITNDYETATAISKGDLNTQMAFMTGKLKVGGNMAKVMMSQGQINAFAKAVSGVEVDY